MSKPSVTHSNFGKENADDQAIIDEATEHPYECRCEKCKLWWEVMGDEE